MRYVAAYLLLVLGGNASPDAAAIKKVLGAVDAEADDAKISALISELQGKSVDELIQAGLGKLSSVPSGAAAAAPAAAAAAPAAAAAKEEPKKEEKEESEDMGFDLFG